MKQFGLSERDQIISFLLYDIKNRGGGGGVGEGGR